MGMFNDNVSARRTEWTYTYTGKELLVKAKMLLGRHTESEQAARNKTAEMLQDVSVNQNDSRFAELKGRITFHGTMKEQCAVFVHEFSRSLAREYELGLGDVTFFEMDKK